MPAGRSAGRSGGVAMEEERLKEVLREVVGEVFEEKTAAFATKDDLKAFATKEEFLEFERRLTNALNGIREGVRLSLYEIEKRLGEIESKLRFYDFNFYSKSERRYYENLEGYIPRADLYRFKAAGT